MVYLNIEKLLEKKGKSKYWLVQKLNSNYTVINKMIDNKTTGVKFDTIEKLCEIFECTPNDLFIIK
jgi:putative transcriptional regulator